MVSRGCWQNPLFNNPYLFFGFWGIRLLGSMDHFHIQAL